MDKRSSVTLMAAALAAGALFGAGCSDRSSTGSVSEKMDRTTDQMSVAADNAAARAAAASDDGTVTVKVKGALMTDPALKPLRGDSAQRNVSFEELGAELRKAFEPATA